MKNLPIQVQLEQDYYFSNKGNILLPSRLAKSLGIPKGNAIISFGSKRIFTNIDYHTDSNIKLLISRSLAKSLLLPTNQKLQIIYHPHKKELRLGPIMGILISRINLHDEAALFDAYTSLCEEAQEAAVRMNCLCYVVTLDNLFVKEGSARGWVLLDNQWKEMTFPLPHVLYNRLTNRADERKSSVIKRFDQLKVAGVSIFNEHFLNKWDVYQNLLTTDVSRYLPSTSMVNQASLKRMLDTYPIVFLKPIMGSEGRGILRIRRINQGFLLDQIKEFGYETIHLSDYNELVTSLITRIKKKAYIIQQGIPFISLGGGTIDFRALLQKNILGNWRIVSIIGRIGNSETFVSNFAQGGKLEKASNLIKTIKTIYPNIPTLPQIKQTAVEIATTLDHFLDGLYGELGIDLGIDINGRIWLIEVNSKPSKKPEGVLENVQRPRPSILHLFEYVHYLSGFHE